MTETRNAHGLPPTVPFVAGFLVGAAVLGGWVWLSRPSQQAGREPIEPSPRSVHAEVPRGSSDEVPWDELLAELAGIRRALAERPETRTPLDGGGEGTDRVEPVGTNEDLALALRELARAIRALEEGNSARRIDVPTPVSLNGLDWEGLAALRRAAPESYDQTLGDLRLLSYQQVLLTLGPPRSIRSVGEELHWSYGEGDGRLTLRFFDGVVIGFAL